VRHSVRLFLHWFPAHQGGILVLLLALTLVRGLIYVALVPPWQAPDEPFHFLSALAINLRDSPDASARWERTQNEVTASLVQHQWWDFVVFVPAVRTSEEIRTHLPPGLDKPEMPAPRAFTYYLLAAVLRLVEHQDVTLQLYLARLLSVVTNVGVVGVAFVVGRLLFADDPFGSSLLPLAVMIMPTNTCAMAGVNDGNPAELFVCVAILFIVVAAVAQPRWWVIASLAVFTALAVLAKPTTYFVVPAFLIVLGWYLWRSLPRWWKLTLLLVVGVVLYGLTVAPGRLLFLLHAAETVVTRSQPGAFVVSLQTVPWQHDLLAIVGRFWADLGWSSLALSDAWAVVFVLLSGVAVIGLVRLGWRGLRRVPHSELDLPLRRVVGLFLVCLLTEMAILAGGSVMWGVSTVVARYLLGLILPILGLLVIGWREMVPCRWRREGLAVMAAFFVCFDTVVLLWYVIPFYYPLWR
jgi:hypothetical protein